MGASAKYVTGQAKLAQVVLAANGNAGTDVWR